MYLTIMLPWLCHVILVGQNLPPILATRPLFSKMADVPTHLSINGAKKEKTRPGKMSSEAKKRKGFSSSTTPASLTKILIRSLSRLNPRTPSNTVPLSSLSLNSVRTVTCSFLFPLTIILFLSTVNEWMVLLVNGNYLGVCFTGLVTWLVAG